MRDVAVVKFVKRDVDVGAAAGQEGCKTAPVSDEIGDALILQVHGVHAEVALFVIGFGVVEAGDRNYVWVSVGHTSWAA